MSGDKNLFKILVIFYTKAANIKVKVTQRSNHIMTPRSSKVVTVEIYKRSRSLSKVKVTKTLTLKIPFKQYFYTKIAKMGSQNRLKGSWSCQGQGHIKVKVKQRSRSHQGQHALPKMSP